MALSDREFQYHLEEYKALKAELGQNFSDSYRAAILTVAANAAIFSFLYSRSEPDHFLQKPEGIALICISIFITACGFWFYRLRRHSVKKATDYLRVLEGQLAHSEMGWERFYSSDLSYRLFIFRTPFVVSVLFFIQFIVGSFLFVFSF